MTAEDLVRPDHGGPVEQPGQGRRGGVGDLSGDVRTVVSDPSGPLHSGDGSQFLNHGAGSQNNHSGDGTQVNVSVGSFVLGALENLGSGPSIRQQIGLRGTADDIELLRAVFVPPHGFADLTERFRPPGSTVILSGPPGSGRRSAAKMLLCPTPEDVGALRLLAGEDLRGDERLTADDVTTDDRMLLDLSTQDESSIAQWEAEVRRCVGIAHQRKAHLVVLIPDRSDNGMHDDLKVHLVQIVRPEPWKVLEKHLGVADLRLSPSNVSVEDCKALSQLPLRGVAEVASLLAETRQQFDQDAAWFSSAMASSADHERAVVDLVSSLETVEQRTLLLTAAMLEDGRADAVFHAENRLQKALRYTAHSDQHRLAEEGFTDRLRAFRKTLKLSPDGAVGFVQLTFGTAVLTHFWDAYPDLREDFGWWVGDCHLWRATRPQDRLAVVLRFADQAARTGQLNELYKIVESWADNGRGEEPGRLAAHAMAQVLRHERAGQAARAQLYQWSRTSGLSVGLGRILVELCTEVVAAGHLKQALIRLWWLADRQVVRAEARRGIADLCAENRALEQFLQVLTDRERFNADLCRFVLSPERLASPWDRAAPVLVPRLAERVVRVWRTAVNDSDEEDWTSATRPWLRQYYRLSELGDNRRAAALLSRLIELCAGEVDRLSALFVMNRAWFRESGQMRTGSLDVAATAVVDAVHRSLGVAPDRLLRTERVR
ncbi:hypothetical protein ACQPXM_27200 [Kribbella sp. CA-253562]|uniref:hypothetical protein n=1 Tax=Kribbella sp. CA-253562 TaxID=3239942 RepID=UPI003D91FDC8